MKMHAVTGRRRTDKGEDGCRRGERGPRLSTVPRAGRFGEAELSEDHANDNRVLHGSRPWCGPLEPGHPAGYTMGHAMLRGLLGDGDGFWATRKSGPNAFTYSVGMGSSRKPRGTSGKWAPGALLKIPRQANLDPGRDPARRESGGPHLWADGHKSVFTNKYLRETCRCAACVKEFTGERSLKPESVPADIRAEEISLVGRYAIQVRWSDGRSTGISPFDTLWAACACETWWRGGVR